jgi:hypothetical protein
MGEQVENRDTSEAGQRKHKSSLDCDVSLSLSLSLQFTTSKDADSAEMERIALRRHLADDETR